jgi:alpha(1,3/1,4) fucosyltransferase
MKKLKIDFCDFWEGFDKHDNYFTGLLGRYYQLEIGPGPDFLFFSTRGEEHLKYNCTRIYYTPESFLPDYLHCDYAISFEMEDNVRNLRFPLYNLYGNMEDLAAPKRPYAEVRKNHTRFCNMVVTNARATKRIEFFHKLSQYKQVDSGGKYLNNIGGPIDDKRAFISKYKFTFAFENKIHPGYTTEKLVEPMFCGSMPIYWGNPFVGQEFNTKSFINWDDYGSDEAVIERIIELDTHDDLYEEVYNQPYFPGNTPNLYCNEDRLMVFLNRIFESPVRNLFYQTSRKATLDYYKTRIFLGSLKNKVKGFLR